MPATSAGCGEIQPNNGHPFEGFAEEDADSVILFSSRARSTAPLECQPIQKKMSHIMPTF